MRIIPIFLAFISFVFFQSSATNKLKISSEYAFGTPDKKNNTYTLTYHKNIFLSGAQIGNLKCDQLSLELEKKTLHKLTACPVSLKYKEYDISSDQLTYTPAREEIKFSGNLIVHKNNKELSQAETGTIDTKTGVIRLIGGKRKIRTNLSAL